MNQFSKSPRRLLPVGLALATILLTACAKKPPSCADSETIQTIQSMVVNDVKEYMPLLSGSPTVYQDDPMNIKDSYYQALKATVINVVSDGYNEQAKKNSCRGNLSVSTLSGQQFSRDIDYSTQSTEDKGGGFLVEVQAFQPFVTSVAGDLAAYYHLKRYAGEWKGDYRCEGIDGMQNGPQGPFSMPVTMVVDKQMNAKLERTTKGGGVEILSGTIGQAMKLAGQGQNSPDDTWRTFFNGAFKGLTLNAEGEIATPEGRVLRQCTLSLQHDTR